MESRPAFDLAPDFNSSDFETDSEQLATKKVKKYGTKIVQAIIDNQAVDRSSLPKVVLALRSSKTLYLHFGMPSVGLSLTPRNTKSNIPGKYALSLNVIRGTWMALIKLLHFRHEEPLKVYGPQIVTRINTHLNHLVEQKKLIRGTWFKKNWLGFRIVLLIAEAWVKSTMEHGTSSWDITLSKLTSVVLQGALSSRSGDITRSQLYEGLECLCWGDITLELKGEPSVQNLRAKLTLRFQKFEKDTMNADKIIFCNPLDNVSQSVACPIKLLLILALRLGHVYGSTLEECLQHAAQRGDKIDRWKSPDSPIFCQLRGLSPFLQLDKAAGQHQNRVDRFAPAIAPQGPSIEGRQKRFKPGEVTEFMKSQNMNISDSKQRKAAGRPASNPLRQRTATEINASRLGKERKRTGEDDERDETFFSQSPASISSSTNVSTAQSSKKSKKSKNSGKNNEQSEKYFFDSLPSMAPQKQQGAPKYPWLDLQLQELEGPENDIELLGLDGLADIVFLNGGEEPHEANSHTGGVLNSQEIDPIDQAMIDDHMANHDVPVSTFSVLVQETQFSEVTTMSGDDFVRFFSTINIAQLQVTFDRSNSAEWAKRVPTGNSRDSPTTFLYFCKKGCGYNDPVRQTLQAHEVNCSGEARVKTFECPRERCTKSYKNESTLKSHIVDTHNFTLVPCAQCPDKQGVLYNSKNELKTHRNREHYVVEEQQCPLKEKCHSSAEFTKKSLLKQHLRRQHDLTTAQVKEYTPDKRKGKPSNYKGKKARPKSAYKVGADDIEDESGDEMQKMRSKDTGTLQSRSTFGKARILLFVEDEE
ncbi:hypothetical protein G7Y89_g5445 [Cudoniella acicularis]|uniref:C2H2-type domain-containing protein n=1 Tax=Cudoniella acicularis TaxID=354080 RepID=A0A8H4W6H4_9HELO|nr:hypothetical protein G7Y89_g5445 [Cudoniella acicularis]